MSKIRKNHGSWFKSKVALEAIKENKTSSPRIHRELKNKAWYVHEKIALLMKLHNIQAKLRKKWKVSNKSCSVYLPRVAVRERHPLGFVF